ncbi:MAG: outer membrane beta-barrel protein [Cyclobacteriaceae bacterium]|nr:outer membrane beta-barrel protein [Cyclobacteriaceae bacterium]
MKRCFFFTILFLIALSVTAQDKKIRFGVSSSFDYNFYGTVTDYPWADYQGKVNFSAGFVFKYQLNERLFFLTKALYSTKNYKLKENENSLFYVPPGSSTPVPVDPGPPMDNPNPVFRNSFVDIPLEIGWSLFNKKNFGIAGVFGFVNSFQVAHKNESFYIDSPVEEKTYNNYLLSTKMGVGFMFKTDKIGFHIEPQARLYVTNVHPKMDENPIHLGIEMQILKL